MNNRVSDQQLTTRQALAEDAIGQIAVSLPGATAVFRRLKLDFCCGGQISLAEAATKKGLDVEAVLAELNALQRSDEVPTEADPLALVNHILSRYHDVHRAELPELIRMARRVEAVHRDHPEVPHGLADHLEVMEQELLSHMAKEEQILFPMMLRNPGTFVSQPIQVMRLEHVDHGANLEVLMQLARNGVAPVGACNTWRALFAGINKLQDDLINHIHLENNLLFPVFEGPAKTRAMASCADDGGCGCAY